MKHIFKANLPSVKGKKVHKNHLKEKILKFEHKITGGTNIKETKN